MIRIFLLGASSLLHIIPTMHIMLIHGGKLRGSSIDGWVESPIPGSEVNLSYIHVPRCVHCFHCEHAGVRCMRMWLRRHCDSNESIMWVDIRSVLVFVRFPLWCQNGTVCTTASNDVCPWTLIRSDCRLKTCDFVHAWIVVTLSVTKPTLTCFCETWLSHGRWMHPHIDSPCVVFFIQC